MKFFVSTYKSILNREKAPNDVYAQTTAEILEKDFPKKLIDENFNFAFAINNEDGKCMFASEEANQEYFFNNLFLQNESNVIFLVNDDDFSEQHKQLIKDSVSKYLDIEVQDL